MRKENVVKLGEVVATKTADVITTGVTAVKAFNSVSTLLPAFALRASVRELEVEKDLALVDFQIQMALEIYKNTEEEYSEYISPERREQALAEFTDIADLAFDALDEIDAKLTLTERCANIAMKTLQNAHSASVMDKKKAAAEKAYKLIMGITDETTIMSLEHTVLPIVEAAIEEAPVTTTPFTQDSHQEVRQLLADAASAMFGTDEIESKEVVQLEVKEEPQEAVVVTHPATQRLEDSITEDVVSNIIQQFSDNAGISTMEQLQDIVCNNNPEVFEQCARQMIESMSEDEFNGIMMCFQEHLKKKEQLA